MIGLILFLALSGQGQARRVTTVPPTYRIRGVVVDATNGGPVAGAEVSIQSEGEAIKATARGDGTFVLDGLPAGKYSLSAKAHGYVSERYNQHGGFSTGVVAGPDQDSEHIVFRLHPAALIYGAATDENGDPVRQGQVMLFEKMPSGSTDFRRQTMTNDLGEYRFAHLEAGRYSVAVQARPWYAESGFRYVQQPERSTSGIIVIAGKPREQLNPALDVIYPITFFRE